LKIILKNNNIIEMGVNAFNNLQNLNFLDLTNNFIMKMPNEIIKNLSL